MLVRQRGIGGGMTCGGVSAIAALLFDVPLRMVRCLVIFFLNRNSFSELSLDEEGDRNLSPSFPFFPTPSGLEYRALERAPLFRPSRIFCPVHSSEGTGSLQPYLRSPRAVAVSRVQPTFS